MGGMCGGEGIAHEELIPPETKAFRQQLYDYIGGPQSGDLFGKGATPYMGQLPFTGGPDYGQMAGINTILALMGYPLHPGQQSMPPNTTGSLYTGADQQASTTNYGGPSPAVHPTKPEKDPYAPKKVRK